MITAVSASKRRIFAWGCGAIHSSLSVSYYYNVFQDLKGLCMKHFNVDWYTGNMDIVWCRFQEFDLHLELECKEWSFNVINFEASDLFLI